MFASLATLKLAQANRILTGPGLVFFAAACLLGAASFSAEAPRLNDGLHPHIVFVIGENEYHTWETLPEFARTELEPRGFKCSYVNAPPEGGNVFSNFAAIQTADLLVVSVRRRTPPKEMMDLIHHHLDAGRPLVGIRTASHAFDAQPPDDRHAAWATFDADVLGGNYQGHYNNKPGQDPPTLVQALAEAAAHPVLAGVPTNEFHVTSHLYKNRNPRRPIIPLMTGHIEGRAELEPVAWVNTNQNRRVCYTSLGSPDDFTQPFFRRLLINGVRWCLNQPPPPIDKKPSASGPLEKPKAEAPKPLGPFSPAESLRRFKVADDLEIQQVLAEPIVKQPVFLNFDERGRMWVVQYQQYPAPAGLNLVSRDQFWRAVYDKVPPPPPHHFRGRDKITIHEDTDGDGVFDKHTTFVDGLNIATAVVKGRGGVWVMNPPYLLFYPDANNDDIPDGDPVVHLEGFGLEDTHSVANSLRWGPDGWLYGAQGSTVTGKIIRPGLDKEPVRTMGQLIWRYHPETKRFEVFAEGGGNAFGVEMDPKGRIFSGHNGGDTRGFHYVQGGYLQKGFEKHGPLSNPYAFGYFPPMKHPPVERFTHNFILYDGGALPGDYAGKLFGVEPLQGRIVESDFFPNGSTFQTVDLGHPVTTSDSYFRPVDIKVGPDGAIYICDWYDMQVNHYRNNEGKMDASNGRIYRLKAKGSKPGQPFDLGQLATAQLVEFLANKNEWYRQTALRVIADRQDHSMVPALEAMVWNNTGQLALEALWALNLSGGLRSAEKLLTHPDPFVRLWTVRLLGDEKKVSSAISRKLLELAAKETHVEARSQLASTARRLPASHGLPIVRNLLAHDEDVKDPYLPLLLWWAIEAKAESDRNAVVALFEDSPFWTQPMVQEHILKRVMRRYAAAGTRKDLLTCARLLELSPGREASLKLMVGFEDAFKGRSLAGLPDELVTAMARHQVGSPAFRLRQGGSDALERALETIRNDQAARQERLEFIEILGEVKQPASVPVLLEVATTARDHELGKAALTALLPYDDPQIGARVVDHYNSFSNEVRSAAHTLLASRAVWALQLAQAADAGHIKPDTVPLEVVRKIKLHKNEALAQLVSKHWPQTGRPTTADMEQQIKRLAEVVRAGSGDPYNGKKLFTAACGSCHTLFNQGGHIGPDLTVYQRNDLDIFLLHIVNPSAEIREGYENFVIETKDERTLTGFLVEQDNRVVVLRGVDGQSITLERNEIQELRAAGMSLMPEGLLDPFNDQQVRDLFAYLRSTQPLAN